MPTLCLLAAPLSSAWTWHGAAITIMVSLFGSTSQTTCGTAEPPSTRTPPPTSTPRMPMPDPFMATISNSDAWSGLGVFVGFRVADMPGTLH